MAYRIMHQVKFDDQGRLFSEQRLTIPANKLPNNFTLERTLADQLNQTYFASVNRFTLSLYHPIIGEQTIRIQMPIVGSILVFNNKQINSTDQKSEVVWNIQGGAMLARAVAKGGQLVIGAEWIDRTQQQLVLYTRVEDYTSRIIGMFGLRLGSFIYRLTQGLSHKFITHRFLHNEAAQLTTNPTRRQ